MDSPQVNLSSELKRFINNRNVLTTRSRMKVLTTLSENDKRCAAEKKMNLRAQAIQELLTTEVTYLKQLEIMMEYFIRPIVEKKMLKHSLLSTLYENIKILYNISGELINELKMDSENIAGAFYKLAPFFKLYSVYAYDYEQVLVLFMTSQENNASLKHFVNSQETRPEINKKLPALLITPIQRVPRYKLLVKEILQHTPNNHKEYNLLQACLVEVEKAATHIDALVAQNEEAQKLLKLQKCIVNRINLVKPGRKLIKEGPLMRVSRRGNSAYRRYFILLNDNLLYCKGEPESSLTVCCVLPLNKCKVESVLSGGLFRVTCLNEILLLYSEKEDSNLWIQSLQNAIKKYTECRQTLRKDSSSRMPLRHNNIYLFPSENIPKKCIKRKRVENDEDGRMQLNSSGILYFKNDNDDEVDMRDKNNWLLLFKKFKRFKNEENSLKESDANNMTSQLDENHFCSKNSVEIYKENTKTSTENVFYTNNENQTSSLKNIMNFFSHVGTSIKDFFKVR